MFCPGCAIQITDDTKFCKSCGANLRSVREAMTSRSDQFDWSKTWVAEMFMTEDERERRRGITPERKRINEIKAGVITTMVGLGAMIFLYFLLGAVANNEPAKDAEIIRRIWLAGLVPFLIGIGLMINGIFLSKKLVNLQSQPAPGPLPTPTTNQLLDAPRVQSSIVENTTAHLPERREAAYAPAREEKR
ncbi:MAG TPA: hypothetical protein PLD20_10690 [Blastocatellia bacterium]|nr:hypothetical protein [Blastocatellia bacterium]HMV85359.1 hypothetical protein [Blastocatellia bacterium]HMX28020.1 hypothetical protein [Blastocatellia bacterium]HMZ18387.1 hypothetical protein [Blastocatellia bacterium]HNG30082.1 hypothetical protein [Blastocatellia bacterium]